MRFATLFIFGALLWDASISKAATNSPKQSVLFVDVDGTLYDDKCGIEQQVRARYKTFLNQRQLLRVVGVADMKRKYGSVIRGLLQESGNASVFEEYYESIYPNLDMTRLHKYIQHRPLCESGYEHINHHIALQALNRIRNTSIVIASNAPEFHVRGVLRRLGLASLPIVSMRTPDKLNYTTKFDEAFWKHVNDEFPQERFDRTLIDDNAQCLRMAQQVGVRAMHVNRKSNNFSECLVESILQLREGPCPLMADYTFNSAKYLREKNMMDHLSINGTTTAVLQQALTGHFAKRLAACTHKKGLKVRVLDLGAGLVNMLPSVAVMVKAATSAVPGVGQPECGVKLHYVAVEKNRSLLKATLSGLHNAGVIVHRKHPLRRGHRVEGAVAGLNVTLDVLHCDYMAWKSIHSLRKHYMRDDTVTSQGRTCAQQGFDLIVGACMADLHPPDALCSQLVQLAGNEGALIWLPLVYNGTTELWHGTSQPQESNQYGPSLPLPTAVDVVAAYHNHLQSLGQQISVLPLLSSMLRYEIQLLSPPRRSAWIVSRERNSYFWASLLHFIAQGTTLSLQCKFNVRAWWQQYLSAAVAGKDHSIRVENVDLIAKVPPIVQKLRGGQNGADPKHPLHEPLRTDSGATVAGCRHAVVFTAPNEVEVVEENVPPLGPKELRIRAHCCAVSTGTEMKAFRGELCSSTEHQPLDTVFEGPSAAPATYPLRYGYSMVGTVDGVGSQLDASAWMGKRVSAFAPHSTVAVVNVADVQEVPADVRDQDAAFLPAVETALSLAMAARPLPGEKVGIVGLGLIGQLTAAVLKLTAPTAILQLVETNDHRREQARDFLQDQGKGKEEFFHPSQLASEEEVGNWDCCIEVSGSLSGLQCALDHTGRHGRAVLGSWFSPSDPAKLRLGTAFHRSEMTLRPSQVSHIPPELAGRWTKQRRFSLAWRLLRRVQPSRLLHQQGKEVPLCNQRAVHRFFMELSEGRWVTGLLRVEDNGADAK